MQGSDHAAPSIPNCPVTPGSAEAQFFIAVSRYLVDAAGVLDCLVEHRAWTKAAYDAGTMLLSGRQDPPTGGVLGFRAPDLAAAEAFVATDPFVINGVATYEVIAISPTPFPWRNREFDSFFMGQ